MNKILSLIMLVLSCSLSSNELTAESSVPVFPIQSQNHSTVYCPWRDSYTQKSAAGQICKTDCAFCTHIADPVNKNHFILARYKHTYLFLNHFPYGPGHILLAPLSHVANPEDLSVEVYLELMLLLKQYPS